MPQKVDNNLLPSYQVAVTETDKGLVQTVSLSPFPQVPGSTQRTWNYDGSGNFTGHTYQDADGNAMGTQTYTIVNGKITHEAWS